MLPFFYLQPKKYDMLVDYNKQIQTLNDLRTGKHKQGLRLGIPEIDEYFVMKPQDFGIWLGHANVGKPALLFI